MVKFSNNTGCKVFDEFESNNADFLNKFLSPQTVTISIIKPKNTEAGDPEFLSSTYNDPLQCYAHYFLEHKAKYIDEIIYNDLVVNSIGETINLSSDELEALVAHELGHFDIEYSNLKLKGVDAEIYCDDLAVKLGYGAYLKRALKLLSSINGVTQKDIDKRIMNIGQKLNKP